MCRLFRNFLADPLQPILRRFVRPSWLLHAFCEAWAYSGFTNILMDEAGLSCPFFPKNSLHCVITWLKYEYWQLDMLSSFIIHHLSFDPLFCLLIVQPAAKDVATKWLEIKKPVSALPHSDLRIPCTAAEADLVALPGVWPRSGMLGVIAVAMTAMFIMFPWVRGALAVYCWWCWYLVLLL